MPELARFISRDTYDLSNRYAYCDGNPIVKADPGGHKSQLLDYAGAGLSFFGAAGATLGSALILASMDSNEERINYLPWIGLGLAGCLLAGAIFAIIPCREKGAAIASALSAAADATPEIGMTASSVTAAGAAGGAITRTESVSIHNAEDLKGKVFCQMIGIGHHFRLTYVPDSRPGDQLMFSYYELTISGVKKDLGFAAESGLGLKGADTFDAGIMKDSEGNYHSPRTSQLGALEVETILRQDTVSYGDLIDFKRCEEGILCQIGGKGVYNKDHMDAAFNRAAQQWIKKGIVYNLTDKTANCEGFVRMMTEQLTGADSHSFF